MSSTLGVWSPKRRTLFDQGFSAGKTEKKLVIAGGASDTAAYMEQLKELAAGDERIVFTGFVQGRRLQELYSNAYVYVLPSDLEGMPLSLLEAMSYGNCCLTSDIPECAEVIGNHGITFQKAMSKICNYSFRDYAINRRWFWTISAGHRIISAENTIGM